MNQNANGHLITIYAGTVASLEELVGILPEHRSGDSHEQAYVDGNGCAYRTLGHRPLRILTDDEESKVRTANAVYTATLKVGGTEIAVKGSTTSNRFVMLAVDEVTLALNLEQTEALAAMLGDAVKRAKSRI